ncbi:MAG TPA: hypothetical protein VMB51_11540 [Solirubrobacteraceae bacterium]|nr:hypothetical protein [Solirubrobacteraceae bacterium]
MGGLLITGFLGWFQRRRKTRQVRSSLASEMMQVAYGFYTTLIESIRRVEHGEASVPVGHLAKAYEAYRVAARVIEAKLTIYYKDQHARWLWHGTIDMLNVRYYEHMFGPASSRLNAMRTRHGQHPRESEIPVQARAMFLTEDELGDPEKVQKRFEEMLDESIAAVLKDRVLPSPRSQQTARVERLPRIQRY